MNNTIRYNIGYKSGDAVFESRVAAYDHHFRYNTPGVVCVFKDHENFEQLNWLLDPNESFEELCHDRALQLRDTHKHITLCFSGGSDCVQVLEIFLKYKIKLDQIIVIRDSLFDIDPHPTNWEIDHHAIPFLKSKDLNIPVKIVDGLTYDQMSKFFTNDYAQQEFNCGKNVDMHAIYLYHIHEMVTGTKFIDGATHPTMLYDEKQDKFYTEIWDTDNFYLRSKFDVEHFFTSHNYPRLHLKQCHLVKNYLREHNLMQATADNYNLNKEVLLKVSRPLSFDTTNSPYFYKLQRYSPREKNSFLEAQDRKTQQLVHELWKIDKDITKKYVGNMLTRIHGGVPAFKLPYGSLMLQKYLE